MHSTIVRAWGYAACALGIIDDMKRAASGRQNPAAATLTSWRSCQALVVCWAVLGAIGCGYLFASSTLPITTLGEPPYWGPGWLRAIAIISGLVIGLPWILVPIVLLIVGLIYIRREALRAMRWLALWTALAATALILETLILTGFGVPLLTPNYQGPAIVSWVDLFESISFAVVGAAMLSLLMGAARHAPDPLSGRG